MRLRSRPSSFSRSLLLRAALGVAAVAWVGSPTTARAGDAAVAQALFDEAMALKGKQEWAKACPKFESSYKLDPALGTLMNLANCFEKVGKIASAWARFEEAYQWAAKNNDDRAEVAQTQRDALAPRLPRLKIVVTNPVSTLTIERDTSEVSAPMYGSALPVDPGPHTLFVKRGDEVLKIQKIEVAEAQSVDVAFDLAAIEKAAPPPAPKKDVVVVGVSPTLRKVGWGVGAAGLAGVVVAGALEGLALSKKSEADDPANCVNKFCTPAGNALVQDAKSMAEVGQWVGIGSLVVVAVGVTLLIVTPSQVVVNDKSDKKEAKARRNLWASPWVAPVPGASREGVQLGGGFVVGGTL